MSGAAGPVQLASDIHERIARGLAIDFYRRRYSSRGVVAHLTTRNFFDGNWDSALCGRTAWLGGGSQDEYDRADSLPLCVNCLERVR